MHRIAAIVLTAIAGCTAFPAAPVQVEDDAGGTQDILEPHDTPELDVPGDAIPDEGSDAARDSVNPRDDLEAPSDVPEPDTLQPFDAGDTAQDLGDGPCLPYRSDGLTVCRETPAHCEVAAAPQQSCEQVCAVGGLACDMRLEALECEYGPGVDDCQDLTNKPGNCLCRHCEKQCEGRACGDDGCGGICGSCAGDAICVDGTCNDAKPWLDLLDERHGFGAGVTGGASGPVCVVSSNADTGPGSLRGCLASGGNVWVRFATDMTILLTSGLDIPSNTTIDGRGATVTIQRDTLLMNGVSNVIVHNVILDGVVHPFEHGIHVRGPSRDIWLHHLSISRWGSSGIRLSDAAQGVTISRCWIADVTRGVNALGDESGLMQFTLDHNVMRGNDRYIPRVRAARAHVYNNVMDGWEAVGAVVTQEGQYRSEGNFYANADRSAAVRNELVDDPTLGYISMSGDAFFGETFGQEYLPSRVFQVPYAYELEVADDALLTDLNTNVGYRPLPFPGR